MKSAAVLLSFALGAGAAPAPRATSGDDAADPAWKDRLTLRVGSSAGDLHGDSDKAIQAAVDYVARLGGGTVEILPGTYRFRNSVFLASRVRLIGHGAQTLLVKEPSFTTQLAQDSDWYDQEITVENADGLRIGDGICLRAAGGGTAIKRTITASDGPRLKLDRALRENVWPTSGRPVNASTLFPILSGEHIEDVAVENLTLDGNGGKNGNLDGNWSGCVWLQDCRRITLRGVEARNFNGDGLSWQICHDVLLERCHSHHHTGFGLHPGSGSQRSIIRHCKLEGNNIGIFFCWGVRGGLAEDNVITGNATGISIGHRDTDNIVRRNTITGSTLTGLLFRPEKDAAAAGHRNVIEGNVFTDNGPETGAAIRFDAPVQGVSLLGNSLTETRGPAQRTGILIGSGVDGLQMEHNTIKGFARDTSRTAR
ncbi:MAG: right-handed parallel beta-helix repeat-containing protein [Verrucomicrobiales bacterium]|nr:right-handed parallel beta-helix repeat-containing protein [Verrucomicrobiales bacterium]